MAAFDEAIMFLTDPSKVKLYSNEERAAMPCPECGATGKAPCTGYGARKRDEWHAARVKITTPRSEDEQEALIEKLARRYAAGWKTQASEWFREPARYPRGRS